MFARNVRRVVTGVVLVVICGAPARGADAPDDLPSWNEGPAKAAIVAFVRAATDKSSPQFVPPAERVATFDNDGTLWVEQPLYTQVVFAVDRVKALAPQHPEWKTAEPFKSILAGDSDLARFSITDFARVVAFEK